jgi:hypothetical protein
LWRSRWQLTAQHLSCSLYTFFSSTTATIQWHKWWMNKAGCHSPNQQR